jgi:uncharacterized membrane protein AbrB (regulator of aidB expression)
MQFLRVMLVALVASIVARLWVAPGAAARTAMDWFPVVAARPLCATMALAVVGSIVGARSRIPAGALLIPLFAGIALSWAHLITITLPPWLMAGCYAGTAIGEERRAVDRELSAPLAPGIVGSANEYHHRSRHGDRSSHDNHPNTEA